MPDIAGNEVKVNPDGSLEFNGHILTTATEAKGLDEVVHFFTSKGSLSSKLSVKNLEKAGAWLVGAIGGTNLFTTIKMPTTLRETLIGASAIILAAIHNNTPDV